MGVSSPTGNGEKRGMEWAGVPGTPLALRPERAAANNASSLGSHSIDNDRADAGDVYMKDDGKPESIHVASTFSPAPTRSADGLVDMKAKVIR